MLVEGRKDGWVGVALCANGAVGLHAPETPHQ